jgi:hypothetical protein
LGIDQENREVKAGATGQKENKEVPMNRQVNAISGRLSLRPPQRRSLEILDRITEIVPPRKGIDLDAVIKVIQSEFSTVIDFEREFPVKISKGFNELKPSAYTVAKKDSLLDFHHSPEDKSNMSKYLFGGFKRCLFYSQKFQSDTERRMAVILDREALKWFRPAKGQFQIFYRWIGDHPEYQPDFVAESEDAV